MNVDGTDQRLVAHVPAPAWLSITADSQFVVFSQYMATAASAWKVPLAGGVPEELAPQFDRAVSSPDGRLLGGIYQPSPTAPSTLAIVSMHGGSQPRVITDYAPATGTGVLEWTPDSRAFIYSTPERFNLFIYPFDGAPRKLTDLSELTLIRADMAHDGRSIIAARGALERNAYRITNFR